MRVQLRATESRQWEVFVEDPTISELAKLNKQMETVAQKLDAMMRLLSDIKLNTGRIPMSGLGSSYNKGG